MTPTPRKSLEPFILDAVEYYPWQIEGIRDCARRRNFLLCDEMGLGKSLQAITIFAIDVFRGRATKALVVCTATLKANWADEFRKFTRIKYTVLGAGINPKTGRPVVLTAAQREAQIVQFDSETDPHVLICNYEQITGHLASLNSCKLDVTIFDEAHLMKNHKAKRTQACLKLRTVRSFVLTGSPMLNQVDELWTLLNRVDPGRFPKFWAFVMRYAVFGGYNNRSVVGVKNETELNEILNSYMIRRLAKDHLGLDEPTIIPRVVELGPKQRALYDKVYNDMILETENGSEDIENALTKFLRLKQICGTTEPFTGEDHSSKLDLCIEDDLELLNAGEKVVVFTQFRSVLAAYSRRMGEASHNRFQTYELSGDTPTGDRVTTVNVWAANPKPAVLVCMLQVAGVGLNMTAAHHGALLDKLFVPELNRQAIFRLNRIGQTLPVRIREYRSRRTVESLRIEKILRDKTALNKAVVEKGGNYKNLLKMVQAMEDDDD